MSFCGFFSFHQGYTKDNNKENRSTSTTISSPRSTLRRQAKANNNLLLPRCVCVFLFCPGFFVYSFLLLSVLHSSWFCRLFFSFWRLVLFWNAFYSPHMVRRFYYPTGRPISKEQLDASLLRLAATFQQLPNCQASREHFGTIAKVIPSLRF